MSNTWTWTKINWETPPEGEYLFWYPPFDGYPKMIRYGELRDYLYQLPTHFLSIPPDPVERDDRRSHAADQERTAIPV